VGKASHPEFSLRPEWQRTGNAYFPTAAKVDGQWWVLRVNCFPDHPLWTLFVGGERRFDIDDTPRAWGQPADQGLPLTESQVEEALRDITAFVAYGSEVGQPCDNLFCCG